MSGQLHYPIDKKHAFETSGSVIEELHHRMPDGKLIVTIQTCMHCGKSFQPKRGRTHCPNCQGFLRSKTTVLQVH
jgi:rubrerythrin